MKCSGENVILHGKVLVLYYQISLYISCYFAKNLECFSNRVDACLEKAVLSLYGCVPGKGCTLFLWMRAWKRLYSLFMDACMEKLSTFSRKNEITIPSLQYRKAKELTVRLYGFVKTLLLEGIDTLGLLLLLRNRSGINSCYACSKKFN